MLKKVKRKLTFVILKLDVSRLPFICLLDSTVLYKCCYYYYCSTWAKSIDHSLSSSSVSTCAKPSIVIWSCDFITPVQPPWSAQSGHSRWL